MSSRTPKFPPAKISRGVSVIPHDAEAFARALYAELHRCDEAGAEWIVVEAPPDLPEWSAHCRPAAARRRVSSEPVRANYFCNFQRSESVRNRRSGKKPGGDAVEWKIGRNFVLRHGLKNEIAPAVLVGPSPNRTQSWQSIVSGVR